MFVVDGDEVVVVCTIEFIYIFVKGVCFDYDLLTSIFLVVEVYSLESLG